MRPKLLLSVVALLSGITATAQAAVPEIVVQARPLDGSQIQYDRPGFTYTLANQSVLVGGTGGGNGSGHGDGGEIVVTARGKITDVNNRKKVAIAPEDVGKRAPSIAIFVLACHNDGACDELQEVMDRCYTGDGDAAACSDLLIGDTFLPEGNKLFTPDERQQMIDYLLEIRYLRQA